MKGEIIRRNANKKGDLKRKGAEKTKKDYHYNLFYKNMQDEEFNLVRFKHLTDAKKCLASLISTGEYIEAHVILFGKKILDYWG